MCLTLEVQVRGPAPGGVRSSVWVCVLYFPIVVPAGAGLRWVVPATARYPRGPRYEKTPISTTTKTSHMPRRVQLNGTAPELAGRRDIFLM